MFDLQQTVRNYKIISEINGGAQGFVYLVEDVETHDQYCLKSMTIHESKKSEFEKTMEVLKLVGQSKEKDVFVKYKEHFFEGKYGILVMEYCGGGDLQALIEKKALNGEKFSEAEITKFLIEGVIALQKLHSLNVIHRDVKTANFLIGNDGKFKLCDLNASKLLEKTTGASTVVGTLEYSAPEVVSSERYSYPVDMFSLGAVLYHMMVGNTPFANELGVNLINLAQGKYAPISAALGYSAPLVELVNLCLSVDPSRRPTPAQVLALPFVAKEQESIAQREAVRAMIAAEVSAAVAQAQAAAGEQQKQLQQTIVNLEKKTAEVSAALAQAQAAAGEQQKQQQQQQQKIAGLEAKSNQVDSLLTEVAALKKQMAVCVVRPDYARPVVKKNFGQGVGGQYVAEEDGWVFGHFNPINQRIQLEVNGRNVGTGPEGLFSAGGVSVGIDCSLFYPVHKGDKYKITGGVWHSVVFYPGVKA